MKYLVAATGKRLDSKVAKRFGHPDYHLIVDSVSKKIIVFPAASQNEPSGSLARFAGYGLSGAISGNFGPGKFAALKAMGIKAYLCRGMKVGEAVEQVESGKVEPMAEPSMKKSVRGGAGQGSGRGRAKKI